MTQGNLWGGCGENKTDIKTIRGKKKVYRTRKGRLEKKIEIKTRQKEITNATTLSNNEDRHRKDSDDQEKNHQYNKHWIMTKRGRDYSRRRELGFLGREWNIQKKKVGGDARQTYPCLSGEEDLTNMIRILGSGLKTPCLLENDEECAPNGRHHLMQIHSQTGR